MQKAEEQQEQEKRKRKKKLKSGDSTFDGIDVEFIREFERPHDAEDYSKIKKAYERTSEDGEYLNRSIEKKADELADRIEEKYPMDYDKKNEECKKISTIMRHYYPILDAPIGDDGEKTVNNAEIQNYISKVLRNYKNGIYLRGYKHKGDYESDLRDHPPKDTSITTGNFLEGLDKLESIDKRLLEPNAFGPINDKLKKLQRKVAGYAVENNLSLYDPEDKIKDQHRISLEPGDPVTNEENKILFKTWADKRRELGDLEYKIADDIDKYPSNDPEIARLGIKEAEARLRLLKGVPDNRITADHEHWMKGMEKRRKDSSSGIPPGREWITKYDLDVGNGRVEDRNPMTKDQTDIRAPKVIREFQFMFRFSGETAIFKNRRASKHKKLQDRKKEVSPKQSDSA